jgi:hypothetical protein
VKSFILSSELRQVALKMEEVRFVETSGPTCQYNSEDRNMNLDRCVNLRSHLKKVLDSKLRTTRKEAVVVGFRAVPSQAHRKRYVIFQPCCSVYLQILI